eukprot:760632-Hanusia_phi.AAC.1
MPSARSQMLLLVALCLASLPSSLQQPNPCATKVLACPDPRSPSLTAHFRSYVPSGPDGCILVQQVAASNQLVQDKNDQMQGAVVAMERARACATSTVPCPPLPEIPADMHGKCVNTLRDCANGNQTVLNKMAEKGNSCGEGSKWCPLEAICSKGLPCAPPNPQCNDTSVRCPDWSCAADAASCPTSGNGSVTCPDGITTA